MPHLVGTLPARIIALSGGMESVWRGLGRVKGHHSGRMGSWGIARLSLESDPAAKA